MKKILIPLFLLFLFSELSYGQFAFGLKAGYNASKLTVPSGIDDIKSSINSGFHAGIFARIGGKVYLQPEAYYTFSGSTIEKSIGKTVDSWQQKVTVGTLDIPVLIGFKIIDVKIIKLRVMAGPEVSFKVNSKVKDLSLVGPIKDSDINKVNWYGQIGAGVDVLFLTLDVRYQFGFNKVINDVTTVVGSAPTTYPVNSKSNLFLVSLGFKIL